VHAARIGRSLGLDVFAGDLQDAPWPAASFDAVTLYHVLEHVHTPAAYLERVAQLLTPGGILLIAVPNFRSWERRFFKQRWAWLDVPIHLHHFEPERLQRLIESVGLRTSDVRMTTAGHSAENSLRQTTFKRAYLVADRLKMARPAVAAFQLLADACRAGSGIILIAHRPA
jgi:SAM-dependent methyltransferase